MRGYKIMAPSLLLVLVTFTVIFAGCVGTNTHWSTDDSLVNTEYRVTDFSNFTPNNTMTIKTYDNFIDLLTILPTTEEKYSALITLYNEDFFKYNLLYAVSLELSSGSTTVKSDKASLNNGTLNLIVNTQTPEIGTTDMAYWVCLFAVSKEMSKEVDEVELLVKNSPGN